MFLDYRLFPASQSPTQMYSLKFSRQRVDHINLVPHLLMTWKTGLSLENSLVLYYP